MKKQKRVILRCGASARVDEDCPKETIDQLNKLVIEFSMKSETLRRSRLDLNTPAELAIRNAIQEVEKVGADVKLTEVVILLSKAKDILSDYVDSNKCKHF